MNTQKVPIKAWDGYRFALMDEEDYERIAVREGRLIGWYETQKHIILGKWYEDGKQICRTLAQEVMRVKDKREVKHIDWDRYNCQKENLQILDMPEGPRLDEELLS